MKKILIIVIIILLGVMCFNAVKGGYNIFGLSVSGIEQIKQDNEMLESKINNTKKMQEVDYPAKLSELNTAAKNLRSTKKTYDELVVYSTEQEVLNASQSERYDIEVLWTRVGNHATSNNVITKMDVVSSSENTPNANDLKFTSTGNYSDLTDFIRDIEDDDKLGFSIEEFEMIPVTGENGSVLQATFRVKDVFINSNTITSINEITSSNNEEQSGDSNNENVNSENNAVKEQNE